MIAVIARGFPLDGGPRVFYWRDDDASLVSLLVRFLQEVRKKTRLFPSGQTRAILCSASSTSLPDYN